MLFFLGTLSRDRPGATEEGWILVRRPCAAQSLCQNSYAAPHGAWWCSSLWGSIGSIHYAYSLCSQAARQNSTRTETGTRGLCWALPSPKMAPAMQMRWSTWGLECRYFRLGPMKLGLSGTAPEHTFPMRTPVAKCALALPAYGTIGYHQSECPNRVLQQSRP